jgi:uncharacterized repeat protein (TIGR02543 family)
MAASADAPAPPAGPVFNQVQLKVLADNDFAIFMGNDIEITRLFYQNEVGWPSQVNSIQTLDVYPEAGETFIYVLPMGGNVFIPPPDGPEAGGDEDWNGVLNDIPLLDYPGGEVAVDRRVSDSRDIFHTGYVLLNNYLTNFTTSSEATSGGTFSALLADAKTASQNLVWSPALRSNHPPRIIIKNICTVSCAGNRFSPAIANGAWNFPDGSAVLFRYPLSNANLPVSPGDREVSVTWKDPQAGGAIDNYLIEYKESSEPDASFKTFGTVTGTVRTSNVTGLTNGVSYTLRVTANNESGSASSLGRSIVPTGTASRPSNQSYGAGDGSVSINFSPPENDGGLAVTNYAYSSDDGETWITRAPASTSTPLTISGLTNGADYSVRIRAINPFGAGDTSLPIAVKPGIVDTRTLTYLVGTLDAHQNLPAGSTLLAGDVFTVPAGPTRTNFTFSEWKDGNVSYNPGDTYTVGSSNPSLTAQWVQNSLLGTTEANRSRVLTWGIVADEAIDVTVSGGASNSVRIQIPANALAAGTEVIFWRLLNDDLAKAKINSSNDYFVNMAITWSIGDDVSLAKTVQTATSPISVTIINSSIVKGATAWQIIGDEVLVAGRAAQDGQLDLIFTEDPVLTAANVSPVPLFGAPVSNSTGFEVEITNFDSTYSWESPSVSAGTVSITSTVATIRTLKVDGLTSGQTAIITQRSFLNSVYQTGTVTGSAATKPGAPTSVTAVKGDTQATVSWSAGSSGGVQITNYTVTASPGGASCTTATTSCTITGLNNNTAYTFTVTATNSVGTSTASGSSSSVTPSPTSYAVTFNSTGGSAVASGSFIAAGSFSAPINPTRSGFTFDGWSTVINDASSKVSLPHTPSVTAPITLYALWVAVSSSSPGGSGSSGGTPTPIPTPTVSPVIPPTPITSPVGSIAGSTEKISIVADDPRQKLVASAGSWKLEIKAELLSGKSKPITEKLTLEFQLGSMAAVSGTGLRPKAKVSVWMFSETIFVGEVETLADGAFATQMPLPASLLPGNYTLQLLTTDSVGKQIILNFPITVSGKVTVGTFKGFLALYTKDLMGQKLSARVAGKWLVQDPITKFESYGFSRFVRFTGAGYKIFVDLYLNSNFLRREVITTR